ncbi:MAG: hypothetical protein ACOWWH_12680 [Eubacteriaceae bacterium]
MGKEILNNKNILVRNSGVHSLLSCTPLETPKTPRASFLNINTSLLQEIGINPFTFYIKLKSLYKNSTIYNYSINKISKLARCSNYLTKKNISILEKHGLIIFNNGNITLRNQKNYSNTGKAKIKISSNSKLKDIKECLLLELLKRKQNQQIYAKLKVIRKDLPKRKTLSKKLLMSEICDNDLVIGIRTLSNYLNVSASYLCNFISKMKKQGKITVKHIKENLNNTPIFNNYCNSGYLFKNKKRQTILFIGSVYSFS